MKLNEEQYNTVMKINAFIKYAREQFPKGCDCFTDCTGCPLQYAHTQSREYKICELLKLSRGA